jgi:hypothetical protein
MFCFVFPNAAYLIVSHCSFEDSPQLKFGDFIFLRQTGGGEVKTGGG